ncbi:diaminopimelate decarboxylase [Actinokineospora fastidiosa]|uniref:Diaminopimelate decarboxylase n=1 Tax=Actinokineospora fastidiosa TaxID=1816 RepID=A0A918LH15_9PSEU|nr:diaminopimelate decarboxylase [Actinokineospora fastidiosa]GGS47875.1 diaminopimelate decarboxylase [Actinokineospora fastidiosa]
MTLFDLVPTLGRSHPVALEPGLWPRSARMTDTADLVVGGVSLIALARTRGTPLHVLDLGEVDRRVGLLRAALPEAEIAYACKALLCRGLVRRLDALGCALDVCSGGEAAVAEAAGFPAERMIMHGTAKTTADVGRPVGRIVLDRPDEPLPPARAQRVLLRIAPEVDARTHPKITTGTGAQQFGVPLAEAEDAVGALLARPGAHLVGLHCHLGSQVFAVDAYEEAARRMVRLLGRVRERYGLTLGELDLGGGLGVPYLPGDADFDLAGYARRVLVALAYESGKAGLPRPRLTVEPGRWVVGPAGVALYRVAAVKGRFVVVDGGMSDNPRPALYGARYHARLVGRRSTAVLVAHTVVGRHCEAADVLADVPLPADLRPGDLLAVPVTGAYQLSMASNYNAVGRPPLVAVHDGTHRLLLRRERAADLLRRDVG